MTRLVLDVAQHLPDHYKCKSDTGCQDLSGFYERIFSKKAL